MSATQKDRRPTGLGCATVELAELISQGVFAATGCDNDLLRLEGLMVLMGLGDGEVYKVEQCMKALI